MLRGHVPASFHATLQEGLSPADSLQEGHPRVQVLLSNGHRHAADLVVFATGVVPNTGWLPPELERGPADGGVAVDASMQSSVPGIYAAGDCCWVRPEARGPQWFQMRLWTQVQPGWTRFLVWTVIIHQGGWMQSTRPGESCMGIISILMTTPRPDPESMISPA